MSIPLITEQEIVNYCGRQTYERGKEFLTYNRFYVVYKDAMSIKAICQGTAAPSYSVQVVFDHQGILAASCTCYKGNIGSCKHTAALVLLWYLQPERFFAKGQLTRVLKKTKKAVLVELLENIITRYPEAPRKYFY